jgi:hypothetical protein
VVAPDGHITRRIKEADYLCEYALVRDADLVAITNDNLTILSCLLDEHGQRLLKLAYPSLSNEKCPLRRLVMGPWLPRNDTLPTRRSAADVDSALALRLCAAFSNLGLAGFYSESLINDQDGALFSEEVMLCNPTTTVKFAANVSAERRRPLAQHDHTVQGRAYRETHRQGGEDAAASGATAAVVRQRATAGGRVKCV